MNIGELARMTGLNASRIRFYERVGLLKAVKRQSNGYRHYSAGSVLILNLIVTAQKAGFSLDELRALMPDERVKWDHARLLDTLRRKVTEIEVLESQLAQNKAQLNALLAEITNKPDDLDCAANARRVLTNIPKID
ncbi:MerR family transcriptional regulator [Cedecea neteri]|uniref:MerR family transcriptional regulator n=1 Tax=Cedecea neteri TaxID=158822 RepID=UPI0005D73CBE|nr:MerR family transcriptional regulator [Cedecea neteri]AJZ91922.1 MerR family transcriptional regulator [Klebsiella michiganensis]WPU21013.1 MerR family transcriptional regulator [Cedecea neteri]